MSKYFKRRFNKSKKLLLLTVRVDCRELEGECHKCNNYFVNICCISLSPSLNCYLPGLEVVILLSFFKPRYVLALVD